jgi:hypothetical protein
MRSKAEHIKQLANALSASAVSVVFAGAAALICRVCFNSGVLLSVLIFAFVFVFVLGVLIFLWKKTDLLRKLVYIKYCLSHTKQTRKYLCPCCNRTLAGFSDFKFGEDSERFNPERFKKQRQDVMCPFCYSAPRQRILACWAEENKSILKQSKILYFAPEYSMMRWFGRNGIELTTADLFDKKTDLKLDITDIDLPDGTYDIVICNHVLEHVSSYEKALCELNRILKTEGMLIISFPIDPDLDGIVEQDTDTPEERIRLFGQYDHVRIFGKNSGEMLGAYGFSVSTIDTESIPGSVLPVTGPADYDSNIIFICKKISDAGSRG